MTEILFYPFSQMTLIEQTEANSLYLLYNHSSMVESFDRRVGDCDLRVESFDFSVGTFDDKMKWT